MTVTESASVLILEDEALIVLDVEEYLRRAGFAIAGTFHSRSSALNLLEVNRADVSMLDVELRDGECAEIARVLQ